MNEPKDDIDKIGQYIHIVSSLMTIAMTTFLFFILIYYFILSDPKAIRWSK